jgi:hypothetical protein
MAFVIAQPPPTAAPARRRRHRLLAVARGPFAVTSIVGSVLIGGGIYLMHRTDSHQFFTR